MKKTTLFSAFLIAALFSLTFTGCTKKRTLGNTLRVAMRAKFKSMDPAHGGDYYSNIQITRAYETLLQYSYLKRPYTIEPNLAEAMPSVSKDGRTYTFKIRKGVRFQDDECFNGGIGRELTAEDFIYSFKRLLDPKEGSDLRWVLDGKVKSLKALDANTLVIELNQRNDSFIHGLTMPGTAVVPREAVEKYGQDFNLHPVGTGPFKLERILSNQVVWVKNPTYRDVRVPQGLEGAGNRIPMIDKIIDDIIVEDQPAWLNFMQSNHDYMLKIPKDNVNRIWGADHKPTKELTDKKINVEAVPGMNFTYVAFNMEDSAVGGDKNRYLRQAMSLAYDEAPVIDKFYLGLATRAEFLIPPGIAGFDPAYRNPVRAYNLIKAREILAANGHADGKGIPELTYESTSDTTNRQIAEYFQRSMAQLGVKVNLNFSTWAELLSKIRKKNVQMFGIQWLYDYPDAENGLQLLYSKNESPGSNEANYKNQKYDQLYLKAAPLSDFGKDGPERRKLIESMRKKFEEDVPWIFGVHKMETRLSHDWVKNFKVHAFEHQIDKYLKIDVEGREKSLQ